LFVFLNLPKPFLNLPKPLFTKEGLFMMLLLVILLGIYLRELRTENVYGLLSSPSFAKRGLGGDFTIPIYPKSIP